MKRIFTLLSAFVCAIGMQAQTTPSITFTADVDGKARTIALATAEVSKVSIDWGDGVLQEYDVTDYDLDWPTEINGTIAGAGTVKIYGTDITDFTASYDKVEDASRISAVDLTNAPALERLDLNGNVITGIDLSKNANLLNVILSSNKLASLDLKANPAITSLTLTNNELSSIDLSGNPALATLKVDNNKIEGVLDLSSNLSLKNIYVADNKLTSVNFGENTTDKIYISMNNNPSLTSLDLTKQTGLSNGTLFITGCDLYLGNIDLKLPAKVKTLNISNNKFTFATMPLPSEFAEVVTNYNNAPQNAMPVDGLLSESGVLDLSSQNNIVGLASEAQATAYTVYAGGAALAEGTDYTIAGGVITFLKSQEDVYVAMTSAAWPKFTGNNALKTETFNVTIQNPSITFTADVDGSERTIELATAEVSQVSVDWGDGILVDYPTIVYDSWSDMSVTGVVKGDGNVKIYGDGITYFSATSQVAEDASHITAVDFSNAVALTNVDVSSNALTSVDISNNVNLTKFVALNNKISSIDVKNNTSLTDLRLTNNQISEIDLSANTSLASVYLDKNSIAGVLDLSSNLSLKNIYVADNKLTSVNFGENTTDKIYISMNNNPSLTSLDLTKQTGLSNGTLFITGCDLYLGNIDLKLPAKVKTLNISNNKFTFATMPLPSEFAEVVTNYNNAPQNAMPVDGLLSESGVLDLSSQNNIVGLASEAQATAYTVYAGGAALAEGTDYTIAGGVITFLKSQEDVYVAMTSAAWPKFTGNNALKTETFSVTVIPTGIESVTSGNETVRYFTISGMPLNGKPTTRGMYIESVNGKSRVVVKK